MTVTQGGRVGVFSDADIQKIAAGIKPLPATVVRLARLCNDPDSHAKAIVDVLSLEPRLAASVIRRANSAAIIGRNPATTVRDAVMRIGFSTTLSVAMGQITMQTLGEAAPSYGYAAGEIWKRAMASSVAAELIVERIPQYIPSDAMTSALLHEIGKLAICKHFGDDALDRIKRLATERFLKQPLIEKELLGTDHATIGTAIVRSWGLPESIAEGVQNYPSAFSIETPTPTVTRLAHLVGLALTRPDEAEDGFFVAEELIRNCGVRVVDPGDLVRLTAERLAAIVQGG